MLRERAFAVGGFSAIGSGLLLLLVFGLNPDPLLLGLVFSGCGLSGFGFFFVYVSAQARRARKALLEAPRLP